MPDPVSHYLSSLAASSRRVIGSDLKIAAALAEGAPWHTLDAATATDLRQRIATSVAPTTGNRRLTAVREVIRACWRLNLMSWDQHVRLLAALPPIRGSRVGRGRALAWSEVELLLQGAPTLEHAALVAVAAGLGLRRSELAGLRWAGLQRRHDLAGVWTLLVRGKGNKERKLRVPERTLRYLRAWQTACPEREHVFRWRSDSGVYCTLVSLARQVGVVLAPHDLRRTFYAECRRSGLDTRDIQRAMGHASITTTIKYDRRSDDEATDVLSRLDSPGDPCDLRGVTR